MWALLSDSQTSFLACFSPIYFVLLYITYSLMDSYMQSQNREERIKSLGLKVWYPHGCHPQKEAKVITPHYDWEQKVMFTFMGLVAILLLSAITLFLIGVWVSGGLLGLIGFFGGVALLGVIGYFIGKFIWERV